MRTVETLEAQTSQKAECQRILLLIWLPPLLLFTFRQFLNVWPDTPK